MKDSVKKFLRDKVKGNEVLMYCDADIYLVYLLFHAIIDLCGSEHPLCLNEKFWKPFFSACKELDSLVAIGGDGNINVRDEVTVVLGRHV